MSVLDNVPAPKKDYNFLSGDISFIDEMDQEKQPMEIDERPESVGDIPEIPEAPAELDDNPDQLNASAEETAQFITDLIDTGASYGLALISKGDAEQYMASADQKRRIQKIIRVYCDRLGGNIPLWLQLTIVLTIVYGSKIPGALDERKINILQAKIAEQEKRIKAYEAEKKARELAQQLEQPKQVDVANGKKEGE
jgi:hypothetical protein